MLFISQKCPYRLTLDNFFKFFQMSIWKMKNHENRSLSIMYKESCIYLNFHNSSFALRYFFNVNGKATMKHTPCLKGIILIIPLWLLPQIIILFKKCWKFQNLFLSKINFSWRKIRIFFLGEVFWNVLFFWNGILI